MSFSFEEVRAGHESDWAQVIARVYRNRPPEPGEFTLSEGERGFLVRDDGRPVAACQVESVRVCRLKDTVPCAAVAGVATLTEARRSGAATALMEGVIGELCTLEVPLSALYPYRHSYYSRFGYANCGFRYQIKCPRERLPDIRPELPVRQLDLSDLSPLKHVYERFCGTRSGCFERSDDAWIDRIGKSNPMVYVCGDPAEAYLWVNLDGFWAEAKVGELAWTTSAGYQTAIATLRGVCENQQHAVWCEPPDSPYIAQFMDQGTEISLHRPTMFACHDVGAALANLRSSEPCEFGFEVEGRGCWTVRSKGGDCTAAPGGNPSFKLDEATFVQGLMGAPSFEESARHGRLKILEAAGFEAAVRLMPPAPVVCMDFF